MKDYVKLILEIIKMGKGIFKLFRREKNAKQKKNILKALEDENTERLRVLNLGRKPRKSK